MPQKKKTYFERHADDGKGGQSFFDRHKSAEFQYLPEAEYPRSYTPRGRVELQKAVNRSGDVDPVFGIIFKNHAIESIGKGESAESAEKVIHREGQELISERDTKRRKNK